MEAVASLSSPRRRRDIQVNTGMTMEGTVRVFFSININVPLVQLPESECW